MAPASFYVIDAGCFNHETSCNKCSTTSNVKQKSKVLIPYVSGVAEFYDESPDYLLDHIFVLWLERQNLVKPTVLQNGNVFMYGIDTDQPEMYEAFWIPYGACVGTVPVKDIYEKYAVMTKHDLRTVCLSHVGKASCTCASPYGWVVLATHADLLRVVVHGKVDIEMW